MLAVMATLSFVVSGGGSAEAGEGRTPTRAEAPARVSPRRNARRGVMPSPCTSAAGGRNRYLPEWRPAGLGFTSPVAAAAGGRSPLEESLGHGVDLGDAGARDRVDACLHLRQGTERLGQELRRVLAHGVGQGVAGH